MILTIDLKFNFVYYEKTYLIFWILNSVLTLPRLFPSAVKRALLLASGAAESALHLHLKKLSHTRWIRPSIFPTLFSLMTIHPAARRRLLTIPTMIHPVRSLIERDRKYLRLLFFIHLLRLLHHLHLSDLDARAFDLHFILCLSKLCMNLSLPTSVQFFAIWFWNSLLHPRSSW